MTLKLALLGTILLLSTLLSNIYALADDLIDTTSTNVDDSSNNNNGGIVLNYPSSAAGIYLHPGSIHHPAHQPGVQELSQKLDTVILLVENAFGKTAERIERVEQKLSRFEQLVGDLDHKLQDYKIDHANLQLLTDRMQKLYNVHTETYRICKDAVVTKNQPSRPFFSGLGRSSHSSDTSSASASSSSDPIVVENGGSDASENGKSPARSEEHDYMLFVIAAATNYTLEKYVTLLERKMAEEFNVFNFIMKEKFEATEETLGKVSRTSKHLLDSHDQLTSGLLAIKETVEDEQTVLESLDVKVGKIQLQNEKDMQQKQEARSAGAPNGACDSNNSNKNSTQVLDAGIRELFEEYMRKLIESKQSNEILNDSASATQEKRERMGKNSLHTDQTQPRSVSGDQPRVPAPPPPQPPPTKKPIQFVTISVSDLPQPNPHDNDDHDHDHKEDDNMVVDHKGLAKPEFKPVKHTNFPRMTCTTKSSAAYPKSCAEIRENGATCDGVYVTIVQRSALKHVYCDMRHMQGGWTVLLRRGRFSNTKQITFEHTFSAYRSGFGDMHLGEFFLGLDNIYQLTKSDGPYDLQIDLEDTTGEYISFQYSGFRIGNLQNDFRFYVDQIKDHDQAHHTLSVAQYRQLASVLFAHNGTQFLTVDRVRKLQGSKSNGPPDQHMAFVGECAQLYQSGWWYGNALPFGVSKQDACKVANGFQLMAQMEHHKKGSSDRSHGKTAHGHYHHQAPLAQHGSPASHLFMYWSKWTNADGTPRVLRHVLMKIRPANFALKK